MSYQQTISEMTRNAAKQAFKYAKAVPADKLEWKPLDSGRSVLDICRELALCAGWSERILSGQGMMDFDEGAQAKMQEQMNAMKTVEDCEAECNRRLDTFLAIVASYPDSKLGDTYTLPFDGGQEITMKQNMEYPLWNFQYHQGQIAYIQTLYGDSKMYW